MSAPQEPLTWVEKTFTVRADDSVPVRAIEANPGWRLLWVGNDSEGCATLTYGWGTPPAGRRAVEYRLYCERHISDCDGTFTVEFREGRVRVMASSDLNGDEPSETDMWLTPDEADSVAVALAAAAWEARWGT